MPPNHTFPGDATTLDTSPPECGTALSDLSSTLLGADLTDALSPTVFVGGSKGVFHLEPGSH